MSQKFDWVLVRGHGNRDIGAIGFIGNDAVAIAAFYDDRDGNHDGKVSMTERVVSAISPLGLDGRAVTQVAMQARVDADIVMRNSSIGQMASRIFVDFAGNLIRDDLDGLFPSRRQDGRSGRRQDRHRQYDQADRDPQRL